MRRAQILEFVNARPSKRYEQISQLVGLGELDSIDRQWGQMKRAAESRVKGLEDNRLDILQRLSDTLEGKVTTEADLISQLSARLAQLGLKPIASRQELVERQQELQQLSPSSEKQAAAQRLQEALTISGEIIQGIKDVSNGYAGRQEKVQAFLRKGRVLQEGAFERLLNEGYTLLEQEEFSQCPLCESPISDAAAFLRNLRQRIDDLHELTRARRQIEDVTSQLENTLNYLLRRWRSLVSNLQAMGLDLYLEEVGACAREIERWSEKLADSDFHPVEQPPFDEWQRLIERVKDNLHSQLQDLRLAQIESDRMKLLDTISRVDVHWGNLEETSIALNKGRYVSQQINAFYAELIEARKRGLQRLRQELEADFKYFYQELHPNEGYEEIKIPVQSAKRSSVDLTTRFYDDEAHPLNYFSEGHLDSLGLCIFLAFIKKFNQDLKVIALDDVLTTVDASHRLRVARLLAREFADFQFIVTTHDQLWARQLEKSIPGAKLIFLKQWSLENGADYWQTRVSDWEYYIEQARMGRSQDAIAGAGRNLEKFLYQMRLNLHLAIPAKRGDDYTIGDLYGPFFKWTDGYQISRPDRPEFMDELNALQSELDEVWHLRNWAGAHFNEWAASVSANEAVSFIRAIQRLVESFECPVCGNLVTYNYSARALICPHCDPTPPPQVSWEYKPEWHVKATELLQYTKPQARRNVVPMTQGVWRAFLRDMRRRLRIPVMATPDDHYEVAHLHVPFFGWLEAHPHQDVSGWAWLVEGWRQALDNFWEGQSRRWRDIADQEAESFVNTVHQITSFFLCKACQQLLSYDEERMIYICADCQRTNEPAGVSSAYWFVRKR